MDKQHRRAHNERMTLHLFLSGRRACFRRPEFKHDLVTYDVITPPAARMILDRLYNPVGFRWSLDRINILNPIKRGWEQATAGEDARWILALHDVAYCLSARLVDNTGADCSNGHIRNFAGAISRAQEQKMVHLGLREFVADLALAPSTPNFEWRDEVMDFGWIPWETGKRKGDRAKFFNAVANSGVIDLTCQNLMLAS